MFVPRWDVGENDSSFQPPSNARKLLQGSMVPADKTLVDDLLDTYKGEGEFVDYYYGRVREILG